MSLHPHPLNSKIGEKEKEMREKEEKNKIFPLSVVKTN